MVDHPRPMALSMQRGHHAGAWKVAYADFVTAMMALFMVLWLTSQDENLRRDLAKYFQDPYNTPMDNSMGVLNNKGQSAQPSNMEGHSKGKAEISDFQVLYEMAQEFMRLLNVETANPDQSAVDIQVTSDGLRVTLYDRDAHPFFIENTAEYTPWGSFVIETLAWLVGRHNFKIRVDGFVAEGFQGNSWEYTAWELSSDRANSTRRLLERYGVYPGQFQSVTSHGSKSPLPFIHPTAEANDRVSISLVLVESFNILDEIDPEDDMPQEQH